ncbi:homoserine kinase [uncultured Microscilla sp.]|uniref:homoserine kinase n=1 Tax=uncultured Microscilla sp. TaxID=432653 RepID=UPI00261D72A9|nr:homoserine kinase [uncultured Microscilla sp.]
MGKKIKVFAPATVANVACGYDVLGFAIDSPGDEVVVELKDEPGVEIVAITGDGGKLPTDTASNTAGVAMQQLIKKTDYEGGAKVWLHKKMPLGSGLGSSAASSAAGAFAMNELLDKPFTSAELVPFAMEGERLACGAAHADNVAPALMGGFVLIRSYAPLDIVPIDTPESLYCTVIHPQIEVATKDARQILKKDIPLTDAVTQWGNVAGLIAGLYRKDYGLISRSLQDVVIEPVRSLLIPSFGEIKAASLKAGALGCGISGSGPSIFSLCQHKEIALEIAHIQAKIFADMGVTSETYTSVINQNGPIVIK